MDSSALTVLSLCSGGGGLDLGLELAVGSARIVCFVEWDAFAIGQLVAQMEAGSLAPAPVWTDLRTFDGKPWRGRVDCITAGYPCQPFSQAGKRGGEDDSRHLWPEVYRVVREVRPALVFLENVAGHVGLGLGGVLRDLRESGYRATATLVRASDVGAPHQRERVFILAVEDGGSSGVGGECATGQDARNRISGGSGGALADTSRTDWRSMRERNGEATAGSANADRGPLFPPGPGDLDAWRRILEADPSLSPALEPPFRLLAHGMAADRRQWLRLLGNGVVPLQAAYAFTALAVGLGLMEARP